VSRSRAIGQAAQQRLCLLVGLGGGRDRDVEAANLVDAVVVDLREDDLLADAERVVAAPVERVGLSPRKSRIRGSAIEISGR
jgi:hypothetical protein